MPIGIGQDVAGQQPRPLLRPRDRAEERGRPVAIPMDELGLHRTERARPEAPPHEERRPRAQPALERGGGEQGECGQDGHEEPAGRIEAAAPHVPRGRREDDHGQERRGRHRAGPIPLPEPEEPGQGEGQDGRVHEEPELLIEEQAGEALGRRTERELRPAPVDPARIEEAVERIVEERARHRRDDAGEDEPQALLRLRGAPEPIDKEDDRQGGIPHVQPGQEGEGDADEEPPPPPQGEGDEQGGRNLREDETGVVQERRAQGRDPGPRFREGFVAEGDTEAFPHLSGQERREERHE